MYVGSLRMEIRLHGCRSLKEKRGVRQKLRDRIRSRFKVSVAEVDTQDDLELLSLGVATLGPDRGPVNKVLSSIANAVEGWGQGELVEEEITIEIH